MTRIFTIVFVCVFAIACQSGDKENASATTPNTAESPLIIPNNSAQTTPNTAESPLITPNNSTQTTPTTGLQDIWVLDSINNIAPDSNYFAHGTPYFDLNLDKKSVSGHTGCNGLNGKLSVKDDKLIFDSLVVSKGKCKDKDFEKKLLKAFHSGVNYHFSNDKLFMNIEPGTVYVFRRIRRA